MPRPEGGEEVPAAHNSKTIHDIEMKFGRVVKNHKLINLVPFNMQVTSSLRHNDVITVKIFAFTKSCQSKLKKFRDVSDFRKRKINDKN